MWQRFSESARKVVFYAQEEAQRHGDCYVSTEHLLLGLLRERDSTACKAILELGVPLKQIQEAIEGQMASKSVHASGDMTLTPRAKRCIDLAYESARDLDDNFIGTEHLLLGLIREEAGLAAKTLTLLKVTEDRVRVQIEKIRPATSQSRVQYDGHQDWVQPIVMEGFEVRLEPLAIKHASDLAEACDPGMFQYFPVFPKSFDKAGLEEYIAMRNRMPLTVAYAIVLKATGRAIGSSSFFDIRPDDKGLEIGHTWIKKEHRGTKINPEIKLLMFGHAFESLGAIRVQQKTDLRNVQSQRAMIKMGCKQEGILRHNMVMPDGHVRDSVYFSVLAEEWPEVKAGLVARLKA